MSEKLKMQTKNKANENYEKLAAMFPNAVTEAIDENGEVVRAIDKDVLMQEISCKVVEGREERYQFTWPDKKQAILAANAPINKTLRPVRDDETVPTGADSNGNPYCSSGSVDFDTTENLYIEGDNLEVLKLLQETYLGKIKMIYIDPPYNTGNDFVYNDDFAENADEYIANSGQLDEKGNRLVQNTESNGRFHTDWLNMMYPRLKLAKDLLTDDGVIFISIDDNEADNLRKICDEIFGEVSFVGGYVKQSKVGGGSDSKYIVKEHEYCLCYAKVINDLEEMFIDHDIEYLKRYSEEDENGKFFWDTFARPGLAKKTEETLIYDIKCPDGSIIKNRWIHSEERFLQELKTGAVRIIKKPNGEWSVQFKQYLNENGKKPRSMTMDFGGTIEGKNEIVKLFENNKIFSYPKSTIFISTLIKTLKSENSIILDFFSGSATTAHAVMQLNAEDGGNRKFIMVQLPEETDEKSEAYKAGYKNICEIGKERIRRAGKKIRNEELGIRNDTEQLSLDNSSLLTPNSSLDTGFRVLKLDSSNMKDVYYNPAEYGQASLSELEDNIKEDRTPEDLLFQVMLDLGVLLSSKIEETAIAGKKVFSVEGNYLIACFDDNVTEDVITEIAKKKPYYFVMRDSSMASDSVAANFEQIFATYSPDTVRRVL